MDILKDIEIKPNSNLSKENPEPEKVPVTIDKKVIEGEVVTRKKTPFKKFLDRFFLDDIPEVKKTLRDEVIIPYLKDLAVDTITNGAEMMIYKGEKPIKPTGKLNLGVTNYNKMSTSRRSSLRRNQVEPVVARSSISDIEYIFKTTDEVEAVITAMLESIENYEKVSVGDFKEAIGKTPEPTDYSYGWTALGGATTQRVKEGYLLRLPKPIVLEK